MIVLIDNVEIAVSIKEQTNGIAQLIWFSSLTISTHNYSTLFGSFGPTHHSMIPIIYHIDSLGQSDEDSRRMTQLR